MPIIKRQQPLPPEGEYCGQARRVTQEWSKPKPLPNGTTPEPVQIFRVPLWLPDGKSVVAYLRVMDSTGWVWANACRSGEMIPPESEEFRISADDFENRKFYFGIKHTEYNGIPRAEVKFHTRSYAIQVNPALEQVSFPNEAPRPIYLQPATPTAGLPQAATPSQEPDDAASQASADSGPPTPPDSGAKEQPGSGITPLDGISEDEFREAIAYAKRLAAEKNNPPKTKAA
jgi:hypothetical protein